MNGKRQAYLFAALLVLLFSLLAVPRLHFPELDHGDDYQDAIILISGVNFAKFGFVQTRFLPLFDLQQDTPHDLYTHYPPLPFIMNGVYRVLFHTDSLVFFRVIALALSLVNLIFWYFSMSLVSGSRKTGFLCGLLYLANPYFMYGMDSISEFMYADVFFSVILYMFLRSAYDPPRRTRAWYALLWLLLAVEACITFEYIIFLALFFLLFRYFVRRGLRYPSWKLMFLFASAPVAGVLLHFLQNAWYFGGIEGAVNDFAAITAQRVGGKDDLAVDFGKWWNLVIARNISLAFVFNHFILIVTAFCSYIAYQGLTLPHKQNIRGLLRMFAALFVCGLTWYTFFPSHSFAHTYVLFLVRHLTPAAAVGFTIVFLVLWHRAGEAGKFRVVKRGVVAGLLGVVVVAGILHSDIPVTRDTVRRADDFLAFKDSLLKLRSISGPKDIVGLNYHRHPFISYYTDRFCVRVYDRPSFEKLDPLPKYFVYIPYNTQASMEILDFLKTAYTPLFTSPSGRFPAVFFERKKEQN